jgi:hypothetical protein
MLRFVDNCFEEIGVEEGFGYSGEEGGKIEHN